MPQLIPSLIPSPYTTITGSPSIVDVDTGGYDLSVGGHGFRLATDQTFYYSRATEPTTVRRFDDSLEPGEQSLSPLPWIKSQSSFHAGAGQLNLEQGFTAFQYQQEQVEHIRFETCLGVDVWTPGQVTRLPDCNFFSFGFTSNCAATATINGIDYAVIGGNGNLYMAEWASGPDANPTVQAVDLSGSTFGGAANCNITSVATDGVNYYALVQLAAVAGNPSVLTYIISGTVGSVAAPNVLYLLGQVVTGTPRYNLCTNPSFETDTSGWTPSTANLSTSSSQAFVGSNSLYVQGNVPGSGGSAQISFACTPGLQYAISAYVYQPSGGGGLPLQITVNDSGLGGNVVNGTPSSLTGQWQRLYVTFTPSKSTAVVVIGTTTGTSNFYLDAVLIEATQSLGTYFDGATASGGGYAYSWDGAAQESTSTATPIGIPENVNGNIGWVKERLIGALGQSVYELAPTSSGFAPLPEPKYTHPVGAVQWTAISDSPTGILVANVIGGSPSIIQFALDTSGGTPILSGGAAIASLPDGEVVYAMQSYLASFLGIGTSRGVRIGTFDTYTGALSLGPLSVNTTSPVLDITGRDRFLYAGYTDQQADGSTGLVRVDLSMTVDAAGRLAYAPDLRPPTSAPSPQGTVTAVALLPNADRVLWLTDEGFFVEGNGPGSNGDAWLKTSRIRYDTAEMKLFKLGRIHGSLNVSDIQVTGITPFAPDQNLGTFGFVVDQDPGEFALPPGLWEWIQLKFDLHGSACTLNSYQVKAFPAPAVQDVITFTVNCFLQETDRYGLDVTDPELPRKRWQNVVDLKNAGNEIRYVEFTNQGAQAELVLIDQIEFRSYSRPTIDDDFGGYITMKLRKTTT